MSRGSVFVKCWSCERRFDITSAEHCTEHLGDENWTTKCPHCGSCICHKFYKMIPLCDSALNNERLLFSGITMTMPSVHKKLCPQPNIINGD